MDATAYEQFLATLPPNRRDVADAIWQHIRQHVAEGYSEQIEGKFLTFKTQSEWYVALANQKNYLSLYLMPMYVYPELRAVFEAGGKKPKMGKSCVNFLQISELPLEAIGRVVGTYAAEDFLAAARQLRQNH
jgi:hypothetical protein